MHKALHPRDDDYMYLEKKGEEDLPASKTAFTHRYKWYMHNPAPVLENYTHKLLWDFDLHADHLISDRSPEL